jgi:hypothetical protein
MKKGFKLVGGFLLVVGLLAGCSSETTSTEDTVTNQEYSKEMEPLMMDLTNTLGEFADQNFEIGNNPYLLEDGVWLTDTADVLYDMQEGVDAVRAVEDVPEDMEDSHDYVLQAMDELQFVIDNYPDAVDNMDIDLLKECSEALTEGGDYFEKAKEEIEFAEGL